jgi:hypothetical protein
MRRPKVLLKENLFSMKSGAGFRWPIFARQFKATRPVTQQKPNAQYDVHGVGTPWIGIGITGL